MTNLPRGLDAQALDGLKQIPDWKTLDQGISTLLIAALDPSLNSKPASLPFYFIPNISLL
jgi:hypothetical protein